MPTQEQIGVGSFVYEDKTLGLQRTLECRIDAIALEVGEISRVIARDLTAQGIKGYRLLFAEAVARREVHHRFRWFGSTASQNEGRQ